MNIIPFDSASLPAYLRNAPQVSNEDLTAHAGTGFPIISIKGKVFTVSREGEKTVIPNPKDPDSPASNIDMVLVKANKATAKVWYANGYTEGSDTKPDCFSNDGVRPDPSSTNKQAASCAACAKNVWGSKISSEGGQRKGKACADSVRIAVATPDQINDPYFIRVPAASIRNLGEYGKMLAKRGVSYQMVVTKIGFDPTSPTPLLTFKPIGFLPEADYAKVKEEATGDVVQVILGSSMGDPEPSSAAEPAAAQEAAAVVEKAKVAPKPSPKPKVTPTEVVEAVAAAVDEAPAKAPAGLEDFDLDSLNFDD